MLLEKPKVFLVLVLLLFLQLARPVVIFGRSEGTDGMLSGRPSW
jgi:hypothetical protein